MTLQFYHFKASPPSRIVLLTIRNLGLENVQTNIVNLFKREQNSPEYYKLNPLNKVPLLQDDDFIVTESRAIAQYLVESQAPDSGLYPNDPKIRALINQRMYYDATVAFPTIIDVVRPVLRTGVTKVEKEKLNNIVECLKNFERFLGEKDWFAGDHVTIADLSILATVATYTALGSSLTNFQNLAKWYKRCEALPGFEENEEGAKFLATTINSKLETPIDWN